MSGHIVTDETGNWYDTEGAADFSVRVVASDWQTELPSELMRPFPLREGPLVRFVIAENGDDTYVTVICHHAIADGLSAAFVLRDLCLYLADPDRPVPSLPAVPLLDELMPPFDPAILDSTLPTHERFQRPFLPDPTALYVMAWAMTDTETAALQARCREEQTSVHAALCAAFLMAHAELEIDGPAATRRVSSPINLRGRVSPPIGEQFGAYINLGVKTDLVCDPQRDFWDMARGVKASLNQATAGDRVFDAIYIFWHRLRQAATGQGPAPFSGVADYDLSITNLGRLDFPAQYGTLRLAAIYGPALNPQGREKVVGVATAAGCLTFTLVAPPGLMDQSSAQALKDNVGQLLTQAMAR
jgi:hypothetical protein